jgi:heavy metal translocating P-type ATPase
MTTISTTQTPELLSEQSAGEIKSERRIVFFLIGGVLVMVTLIAKWFNITDEKIAEVPALIGAGVLGAILVRDAIKELAQLRPSSATLVALAILAAFAIQQYAIAGLLALFLLVFTEAVNHTASGAQRAIEQLVGLTPDVARIVDERGERDIPLEDVKVGMMVRVRPGENLPVDGKIRSGRSTINQASLTGESDPTEAEEGDDVYAGTTNLTGVIDVEAMQVGEDTTIGKVSQLIAEAESTRTPAQLLIEQVARFYVPVALSVALIVWFFKSKNPATKDDAALTAVTVLVVSCPSALLVSTSSAMVAAFAAAARLGVMIKKTDYLETSAQIDTVVLDKTGTITTGEFSVSRLAPAEGVDGAELLKAATNGEQHSNHPLAHAIVSTARKARITPDGTNEFEESHGRGVRAKTTMGEICVGRASWLRELNPSVGQAMTEVEAKIEGMTGVHVMRDGKYLGAVGLEDTVRRNTKNVIQRLRDLGVRQIMIFTGDRLGVAKRVGLAVGADAIEAECLPEEKHQLIEAFTRSNRRVMMVGDGINDGPSLAAADVGVAMGLSGSDIAANSAGVALMKDDLSRIPFLIELARRTRIVIAQNIVGSILLALFGLTLAATGRLVAIGEIGILLATLFYLVPPILVFGNSFRLVRFGEQIAETEEEEEARIPRREASIRGLTGPQPA